MDAMSMQLIGYSNHDGYCVNDDSGTTWGAHPPYDGDLLFIKVGNMVTAFGMPADERVMAALQDGPLDWEGDLDFSKAVASAEDAMGLIAMMHEEF